MTITKRTVPTYSADINGRIQVHEYNQVIETTQDEDGNDVIEVIKSIPHSGVIDPAEGDYDERVKALGERLSGSLAASQESKIRVTETKCRMAEDMCVKHCETIAEGAKKIASLEQTIATQNETIATLEGKLEDLRVTPIIAPVKR